MHTIAETRPAGGAAGRASPGRAGLGVAGTGIGSILRRLVTWYERSRQRRALLALDDWVLKDIGLTRADIDRESAKPFWRE